VPTASAAGQAVSPKNKFLEFVTQLLKLSSITGSPQFSVPKRYIKTAKVDSCCTPPSRSTADRG